MKSWLRPLCASAVTAEPSRREVAPAEDDQDGQEECPRIAARRSAGRSDAVSGSAAVLGKALRPHRTQSAHQNTGRS